MGPKIKREKGNLQLQANEIQEREFLCWKKNCETDPYRDAVEMKNMRTGVNFFKG